MRRSAVNGGNILAGFLLLYNRDKLLHLADLAGVDRQKRNVQNIAKGVGYHRGNAGVGKTAFAHHDHYAAQILCLHFLFSQKRINAGEQFPVSAGICKIFKR